MQTYTHVHAHAITHTQAHTRILLSYAPGHIITVTFVYVTVTNLPDRNDYGRKGYLGSDFCRDLGSPSWERRDGDSSSHYGGSMWIPQMLVDQ